MIVKKTLSLKSMYEFSGHHIWWLTTWMSLVTLLYYFTGSKLILFPWLPISLVGTAVAFYVGFKNNQSYGRLWEARRIWDEITSYSRQLAVMVKNYRSEEAASQGADKAIRLQIIYRHIAYLYQLREQLLVPTIWEHVSLHNVWRVGRHNRQRRARLNEMFRSELDEIAGRNYLSVEELISMQAHSNKAVQLLEVQSQMVQHLYDIKAINTIQQINIQGTINCLYCAQGKVERIKESPFPRKYASFSFLFVCIFVFLLPFGIIAEFSKIGTAAIWLSIPVGVIVSWVYLVLEMIGDYSENPFEGLHNDTPMLSICRNIEIDMLDMISEKNIPEPIQPKEYVLF